MNTSRLRWLIAGLLLLVANSVAPAEILGQFQQKLTIAEFIKETDGLIQRVQSLSDNSATARDLRESLPDHITVSNDSHEYSISYAWLKSDLAELSGANAAKRSRLLKEIEDRLQQTEQQARALALAAPVADNSS